MTIKEIANQLGLSSSTVSRVLNGQARKYRISERTENLVRELVAEHGYSPNLVARNLRLQKTDTIGLVIPDISNPFFANMAKVLELELRKLGKMILLCDTHEESDVEMDYLSLLIGRKVDGLLIAPVGLHSEHLQDLEISTILIDRYFEESNIPFVSTDNYAGAYKATQYLIEKGHKRIACLQGLQRTVPNQERIKGFKHAMQDAKLWLGDNQVLGRDFSIQSGYLSAKKLMKEGTCPSAFFTLSNQIAIGAIDAIRESGRAIPGDISIISFDDQPYFRLTDPAITTIQQPVEMIAKKAVSMLMDRMEGNEVLSSLLNPSMIERASVRVL